MTHSPIPAAEVVPESLPVAMAVYQVPGKPGAFIFSEERRDIRAALSKLEEVKLVRLSDALAYGQECMAAAPLIHAEAVAISAGRKVLEWIDYAKALERGAEGAVAGENQRLRDRVTDLTARLARAQEAGREAVLPEALQRRQRFAGIWTCWTICTLEQATRVRGLSSWQVRGLFPGALTNAEGEKL